MLRLTCLVVALSGCFGGSKPAPPPAPDEEAEPEAPADEAEGADAIPVQDPIARGDERSYATRWLVVVQRSLERSAPFPKLAALEEVESVDTSPVRLYSSHLNGLRPCEDLVVASAYDRKEEARYFGHKLEQAGFTVDVLQAGAHAPLDVRVERWCASSREAVPSGCPSGMHFVVSHGGKQWLDLDLGTRAVEGALESEGVEPLAVDEDDSAWWSTPLPMKELDENTAVGDVWVGFGRGEEPVDCRVRGFSVVTRGTPHHREAEDAEEPVCGEPRLFARLDCPERVVWAVRDDVEPPVRFTRVTDREPKPTAMAAAMVTLTGGGVYSRVRSEAQEKAEAERALLEESTDIRMFRTDDGQEVLLVEGTLKTGEGDLTCGSAEVNTQVVGVVDTRGNVLTEFRELSGKVLGLVDTDRDGRPEIIQEQWPEMPTVFDATGASVCRLPTDYCESPCATDLD